MRKFYHFVRQFRNPAAVPARAASSSSLTDPSLLPTKQNINDENMADNENKITPTRTVCERVTPISLIKQAKILSDSGNKSEAHRMWKEFYNTMQENYRFDNNLLNDITELLFKIANLDQLSIFLSRKYGCGIEINIDESPTKTPGGVVKWALDVSGNSKFTFNSRLMDHPYSTVILKHWVQVLPILTYYQKLNDRESGEVLLNVEDVGSAPGITYCDARPEYILIPDPIFMQTNGYADIKQFYSQRNTSWDARRPVAFWRGQTTGWLNCSGRPIRDWIELPRVQLCQLQGRSGGEVLDVGLTGLAQIGDPASQDQIKRSGLMKPFLAANEFQSYRYQIDIDGNTNAWPGLLTKLATGSPVLKVSSPGKFRQWYYDRLVPWVNYIPVAADMSDLLEKVRWLQRHDDFAQRVGENGRQLAYSMTPDSEVVLAQHYVGRAFREAQAREQERAMLKLHSI